MSKPLVEDILTQARARLGDDQIAGGEIYTDQVLFPFFWQAYRELIRALVSGTEADVLIERNYNLPANTLVLDPVTAGLASFAEPMSIYWRPAAATLAISNIIVSGSSATVTIASTATLGTGQIVETFGIVGFDDFNSPNGQFAITVLNGTQFTLNGCTATGTYVSGGTVATGTGNFQIMVPRDQIEFITPTSGGDIPAVYAWMSGVLRFFPSSIIRELRITYRASGNAPVPSNAIVQVDDSQDFLAVRTASFAAAAKGGDETAQALKMEALGPSGETELGTGGLLRQLVASDIRNMQRVPVRRPPFRPRRTGPSPILY